jgi:hypothetical protein
MIVLELCFFEWSRPELHWGFLPRQGSVLTTGPRDLEIYLLFLFINIFI